MTMAKREKRQYLSEIVNLENIAPQDHFLRIIEKYFDRELYIWWGRKTIF